MTLIVTMNSWDILAIHDTTKTIIMALVQSLFIVLIADAPVAQAFLSAVAAIFAIVVFYQVRAEGFLDHYGISQQQNLKQGGREETHPDTPHQEPTKSNPPPLPSISHSPKNTNRNLKRTAGTPRELEIGVVNGTDPLAMPENLDDFLGEIEEPPQPTTNSLNQSTPVGLTQDAVKPATFASTPQQQSEPKQEPTQEPSKQPTVASPSNSHPATTDTPRFQDERVYAVAPERPSAPGANPNSDRNSPTQGGNPIPRVDTPGYTEASSIGGNSGLQEADDL